MEFKLIGADCSNGMKIIKNLYKDEREVEVPINIEKISAKEKEKYGIKVISNKKAGGKTWKSAANAYTMSLSGR